MALKPAPNGTGSKSLGPNETLYAILASFVISIVLASLVAGNPFSAVVHAYTDYSREPYHGTPIASDTHAPANNGATQAK